MPRPYDRSLSVLVCDDVREEVGHKSTLVGVYQSDLCVHEAPTTLPRLSFFFRAYAASARPFKHLVVRVTRDGENFLTADFAPEALPTPEPGDDGRYHVQIVLQASPFEITTAGELGFYADTEDGTLDGGRLPIRVLQQTSLSLQ
jgi:hypothetical protein